MSANILVYGTLKSGQHNNALLGDAKLTGTVRVPGYDLYHLGWYPGIRPNPDNQLGVECEMYELADPEQIHQTDYYEGYYPDEEEISLFVRKEVEVNGKQAFIYQYNRDPHGTAFKIEEGVW